MTHRLTIPDWRPCRDNELVYKHWAVASKQKKADVQIVGCYAKQQNIPPALDKRRVSLEITLKGQQKPADEFAYCKSLMDALVKCRLLIDDSMQFMVWGGVTYRRGKQAQTVIVLEDLED